MSLVNVIKRIYICQFLKTSVLEIFALLGLSPRFVYEMIKFQNIFMLILKRPLWMETIGNFAPKM